MPPSHQGVEVRERPGFHRCIPGLCTPWGTPAEPGHTRQGETEGTAGKGSEGQGQLLGLLWDLGILTPGVCGARFPGVPAPSPVGIHPHPSVLGPLGINPAQRLPHPCS